MIFYGKFRTGPGVEYVNGWPPHLDSMYLEFPKGVPDKYLPEDLKDAGSPTLLCDWDECDYGYDPKTGEGSFRCKGVWLADYVYANGDIELFKNAVIDTVCVSSVSESDLSNFQMTGLLVMDDEKEYEFQRSQLAARYIEPHE